MQPTPSVSMHCDCQAAISIAKNKAFNGKNRHIRLRHEVVKQLLKDGIISIDYVKSKVNLADPITKVGFPSLLISYCLKSHSTRFFQN